jgi:Calcium-activated chloride channel
VALYFLWLGHYTSWLFPAAFIGVLAWIGIANNNNDPNSAVIPYYSAFMALWATSFLESWKRKEAWYGMRWGTGGFEDEEQARPQFKGERMPSAVSGEIELYFSKTEYSRRMCVSIAVITMAVIVVIIVVASLFVLRYVMNNSNIENGSIYTSIMQAIVIGILNFIYGFIATALNDHENHRTDTEYEDNLIAKVFIFQVRTLRHIYLSMCILLLIKTHSV